MAWLFYILYHLRNGAPGRRFESGRDHSISRVPLPGVPVQWLSCFHCYQVAVLLTTPLLWENPPGFGIYAPSGYGPLRALPPRSPRADAATIGLLSSLVTFGKRRNATEAQALQIFGPYFVSTFKQGTEFSTVTQTEKELWLQCSFWSCHD